MSKPPNKNNWYLLVLLIIGSALFLLSINGSFSSLQGFGLQTRVYITTPLQVFANNLNELSAFWSGLQDIKTENARLKIELATLMQEHETLSQLEEQNKYLRTQLHAEIPQEVPKLLSSVVKYEYVPNPGYVYIHIGANSNVAIGDIATSFNYAVGEVVEVLGEFAKIRLLTAAETQVAVKIGKNEIVGLLQGEGGIGMKVINVRKQAKLKKKDKILFLTEKGIFAKEYIIGYVEEVIGFEADSTSTVIVQSPIDFQKLQYLIIISQDA